MFFRTEIPAHSRHSYLFGTFVFHFDYYLFPENFMLFCVNLAVLPLLPSFWCFNAVKRLKILLKKCLLSLPGEPLSVLS